MSELIHATITIRNNDGSAVDAMPAMGILGELSYGIDDAEWVASHGAEAVINALVEVSDDESQQLEKHGWIEIRETVGNANVEINAEMP